MESQRAFGGTQGHLWHLRPWRREEQFRELWKRKGMTCETSASVKGLWESCNKDWLMEVLPHAAAVHVSGEGRNESD